MSTYPRPSEETRQRMAGLEERLADTLAERRAITNRVKRDGRSTYDKVETAQFHEISETVKGLRQSISELRDKAEGLSSLENAADRFGKSGGGADSASAGRRFAESAATALQKMSGETRAVISGSVDVPSFVDLPTALMETPFPDRLIDVLGNRISIPSYTYEYYQQTARTNNAAPVADLALKPTSDFTVEAVSGRAEIIATLTQPAPIRIWWDFQSLVDWLYQQSFGSVMDAVENQVISGNGSGVNQLGILNTAGTTGIGFSTDVPTTLRSALTAMQNLGEHPTAWVLNPADAETIDLTRWSTAGGFLSGGYQNDPGARYGTSMNIFGPNDIARVVTPHVPQGTALLADFRELALFLRHSIRIDVATTGTPAGGNDLFATNAFVLRCEIPVGVGILRPQAFAVIALGGGS
jgi:HK97 family phage major capsid protein